MNFKQWCLDNKKDELLKEWDFEKNDPILPENVAPFSHKKVFWKCSNNHSFSAPVSQRTRGRNCPYCSGRYAIKGINDLQTINPELAKEWHPTKNGDLKPCDFLPNSEKKVWWKYKCGHEYIASIKDRNVGNGCPICAGKVVIPGINDLQTVNPELAKEWHPTKNGNLTPIKVTPNSHKMIWWKCPNGHEYQENVYHRNVGRNCPYCSNHRPIKGVNDLQTVNPELAKEWHPTKNGDLKPCDFLPNSEKKVWWLCTKGHSFLTDISHRNNGRGCPVCDRENKTSFPEQAIFYYLSKQNDVMSKAKIDGFEIDIFIPKLNIGIEYDGIAFHSNNASKIREENKDKTLSKKGIKIIRIKESNSTSLDIRNDVIYYPFDRGEYKYLGLVINNLFKMIKQPKCNIDLDRDRALIYSQYLETEKQNSIITKMPSLIREWDFEKNGGLKPEYLSYGSSKKVWWKCSSGHSYLMSPYNRFRGRKCPICAGKKIIQGENDLESIYPELIKEWDFEMNKQLKPHQLTAKSNKKVWWKCNKCGYSWQATPHHRANGTGCPKCAHKVKP